MKNQIGISALGLLFLLCIGGFFVVCLMKVGPLYYDDYKMQSILERVGTEGIPLQDQSIPQIRRNISNQFTVDGIRDLDINDIKIEKDGDTVTLSLSREARVNLFGSLDVVLSSENYFSTADF